MVGLLLLSSLAHAAPLPVPWQSGVHVYTHPEGWRPKGVSDAQLATIESTAQKLHTPVYVVLIDGNDLPGTGNGQRRLQVTTDSLMSAWGEQGLDLSRYSVFTVAWGDDCDKPPSGRASGTVCEYFLNTGSEYIHGPAHFLPSRDHQPITDQFRKRVATSPQDPVRGIQAVLQAVDQRIWPHIDPVQVHKRAKAELEQSITAARSSLDSLASVERASLLAVIDAAAAVLEREHADELHQMARTLREAHQDALHHADLRKRARTDARDRVGALEATMMAEPDLPAELKKEVLDRTREAREKLDKGNTIEDFAAITTGLAPLLEETTREAKRVRQERDEKLRRRSAAGLGGTGLLAVVGTLLGLRRRRRQDALEDFEAACAKRTEQLTTAKARYTELELDERKELALLADTVGHTAAERESVRAELDAIYAGIQALQSSLDRARAYASQAGALDAAALKKATDAIDEPFQFDTGQLLNDQLFTGGTRVLHIHPPRFMQELQDRFAAAVARRDRLREAAAIRFKAGVDLLPHAAFDALEARAMQAGIPVSWLSDHPLYGDDESDRSVWADLDDNRARDPLLSLNKLDTHRDTEARCSTRLDAFTEALKHVQAEATREAPGHPPTEMDRADDPAQSWSRARALHHRAMSELQVGDAADDAERLVQQLHIAAEGYARAEEQAKALASAVRTVDMQFRDVSDLHDRLSRDLDARSSDIERASHVHVAAPEARAWLDGGRRTLEEGQRFLANARVHLDRKRHLDAVRSSEQARQRFESIHADLEAIDQHLMALEAQRRRYEDARSKLQSKRRDTEHKIASYGEITVLQNLPVDARYGATDYAEALAQIRRVEEQWDRAVRQARQSHAARQARAAAASSVRVTRRSTFSSSGGGSSFGSSGSSGGGSSFGSSGSSGGGGGW
jgi:hypothetical protein